MKRFLKFIALSFAAVLLFGFTACKDDPNTIRVGASAVPHAEILAAVEDDLKEQGYTLKIDIYSDYVLPNTAVQSGELLANFFQHQPYLTQFNKDNGTDLVSVGSIHYEAFAIYSETVTDVANVSADATVAIPNDGSNRARALLLLQDAGLVELKDGGSVSSTKEDVLPSSKLSKDNIREMEAALLPEAMKEVTLAVINGNYALTNQVDTSKAILIEEASVAAAGYANVLCVKRGNEEDPRVVALLEALTSRKVKDFIEQKYNGFVVAVF